MAKADVNMYLVGTTQVYTSTPYYLLLNSVNSANLATEYTDGVTNMITVLGETMKIIYTYTPADSNNGLGSPIGAKNAGSYQVSAQLDLGEEESNFNAWESPLTATLEISKVNLVNSGGVFEKVYDGTTHLTLGTLSGICDNDKEFIEYSGHYADKNVGNNKTIVISFRIKQEIVEQYGDAYDYILGNYILPSLTSGIITVRHLVLSGNLDWVKEYDGTATSVNNDHLTFVPGNDIVIVDGVADDITVTAFYNSRHVLEATTIVFALTGSDATNYSIDNLVLRTAQQIAGGNYLILPRSTGITWFNYNKIYNGLTQDVNASINVVGEDVTIENNGVIQLTLTLDYTHNYVDGVLTPLATPITNAVFRNAGLYIAQVQGGLESNMAADYGIESTNQVCSITQAMATINWRGYTAVYTYNGTDQSGSLSVEVVLLGDDIEIYAGNTSCMSFEFIYNETGEAVSTFRDAGEYTYTVIFNDPDLINNYILSDNTRTINMLRADINNIQFQNDVAGGNVIPYKWTYYYGETMYFFITSTLNPYGFDVTDNANGGFSAYKYPYDNEAIDVIYDGGEFHHMSVTGNNGVKNVGTYYITATVAQTRNYNFWQGSIIVIVELGTIDNVYLTGYATKYDGLDHYVYASNSPDTPQTTNVRVTLPDGTDANVMYAIMVYEYYNPNYFEPYFLDWGTRNNYATNAGTYLVSAKITNDNYAEWVVNYVGLAIQPEEVNVNWTYNGLEYPDYTYNAADQTSTMVALIYRLGNTTEQNRIIYLDVNVLLTDSVDASLEPLKHLFILAGNYSVSADFRSSDPERELHRNNYTLSPLTLTKEVTMKQFIVDIKWSYACTCEHESQLYDENDPCIYDGTIHGVSAIGYGIGNAIMGIETTGDFSGRNAGNYNAYITSIIEDYDTIMISGSTYSMPYSMNYTLPENVALQWKIDKRPITLAVDQADSYLSKIYDDSAVFTLGTLDKEFITLGNLSTVYFMYNVLEASPDGRPNKIVYIIGNIIAGDEDVLSLTVTSLIANDFNVTASSVTLTFGELSFSESVQNYYISGNITGLSYTGEDIIKPKQITVTIASGFGHVYNGRTFEMNFDENNRIFRVADVNALFTMTDTLTGANINELLNTNAQNYFYGNFNINGGILVGTHSFNGSLSTRDQEGAVNYDITLNMPNVYIITPRKLYIKYENQLQTINGEHLDLTGYVVSSLSDLTDMEWGIPGYQYLDPTTQIELKRQALVDLMNSDGFTFTVINGWREQAASFTQYASIVGSEDSELLRVVASGSRRDCYDFDYPILQLTYIEVLDADTYQFRIWSIDDLIHLESDVRGLREARILSGTGRTPTYYQFANVSGIRADGSYVVFKPIEDFDGEYYGNGYTISDIMIYGNATACGKTNDLTMAGLFASAYNASIINVKVLNAAVYAANQATYVGGIVGYADTTILSGNTFQGYIYSYGSPNLVNIGGIVGEAIDCEVTDNTVAGYIKTEAYGVYAGGIIGSFDAVATRPEISVIISGNRSFVEITAIGQAASSAGGVVGHVGTIEPYDREDSINTYLKNGIYLNGTIVSNSVGNFTDNTGSMTYDQYSTMGGELINLVKTRVMKMYLLPSGIDGTASKPIVITNYRQIVLLSLYGWANFRLANDVYYPASYQLTTYRESFYGTFTVLNDARIFFNKPSDMPLFTAGNITVYYYDNR